jgi:hypothetical protein
MKALLFTLLTLWACNFVKAQSPCGTDLVAGFSDSVSGNILYLYDQTSTDNGWVVDRRYWIYDDGTFDSVAIEPVHVYSQPGTYTIALVIQGKQPIDTVTTNYCTDTAYAQIFIMTSDIPENSTGSWVVYPNPSSGYISIKGPEQLIKQVVIYNMYGQELGRVVQPRGLIELPENDNNSAYLIRIELLDRDIIQQVRVER